MFSQSNLASDLISQSKKMTGTCVIPDFFSADVDFFNNRLLDVLRGFSLKNAVPKYRVWIGQHQSAEYWNKVRENPPEDHENLQHWASRVFGNLKFGIIATNVELYSTDLNDKILERLAPIIHETKIPSGGFEIALFLGNYGWTPIGVHKDFNGAKVVHFHLGPGNKSIYQWDDEVYSKLTEDQPNFTNPSEILSGATEFNFKAGDVYFMNEKDGMSEERTSSLLVLLFGLTSLIMHNCLVTSI